MLKTHSKIYSAYHTDYRLPSGNVIPFNTHTGDLPQSHWCELSMIKFALLTRSEAIRNAYRLR